MIADGGLLPHLRRKLAGRRAAIAGLLATCVLGAGDAASQQPVRTTPDGDWRVLEADGRAPAFELFGPRPSLRIDAAAGRVSGYTGVNQFNGPVVVEGESVRFGPAAMTHRAGPQPAMEFENAMLDAMQRAETWRIVGSTLEFLDADGATRMRLGPFS